MSGDACFGGDGKAINSGQFDGLSTAEFKEQITNWLAEHPAVQEAITVGVPDKVRGEEVASFIIPKEGYQISQEEIINHCKKKLPDFKHPKTVYFLKDFPKTQTGKVVKRELVRIWEEMQSKGIYGGFIPEEKPK